MILLDISWVNLHLQFIRDCFQDNDANSGVPSSDKLGADRGLNIGSLISPV